MNRLMFLFILVFAHETIYAQFRPSFQGYSLPVEVQERGITTENFKLFFNFYFQTDYDTNFFRSDEKDATGVVPVTIFHFMPGIQIANYKSRFVNFSLDTLGDFRYYITSDEKHKAFVDKQDKVGGNINLSVEFNPKGYFVFFIKDYFKRVIEPRNTASSYTFSRIFNSGGLGFKIYPGGRGMEIILGYFLTRDVFDNLYGDKSTIKANYNYWMHNPYFIFNWKFFPKTSFFINVNSRLIRYDAKLAVSKTVYSNFNSNPVEVLTGFNGFFTKKIFFTLSGGYGNSFHEEGDSYNNFLAHVLVGYLYKESLIFQIGYDRTFVESLYSNYYTSDAIFSSLQLQFRRWINLQADIRYQFITYSPLPAQPFKDYFLSEDIRKDNFLSISFNIQFNFWKYLAVNLGYKFAADYTDFYSMYIPTGVKDYGSFVKHLIYGNIDLRY